MNRTKKIIGAVIISCILLLLTKNVYAFSDHVWYHYNKGTNNIDYGATGYQENSTNSTKQILWCRSKGGKLTTRDGLIEFNATDTEKNMNRLLACWLYLVGGENGKSPKAGFTSYDIQKILWHQDSDKFSDPYQIQNFAANISTPPDISEALKSKYQQAVKEIKRADSTDTQKEKDYSIFKITNKNGLCKLDKNNDDTAHPKFTSVPGQTVAGEPTGCYYLKQVKLEFKYDAKGDGTYSVVTGIHLIDEDGFEVTKDINGNETKEGENLSFRQNGTVFKGTKENYKKIQPKQDIRVYIPTNLIEVGKKYYVYFEQEWQIKGSDNKKEVYTGTYRLYARRARQKLISYNVKKETKNNDDISGDNDAWIAIKVPPTDKKGKLTYAKYLYGVYAKDTSSLDTKTLVEKGTSETVMNDWKLVGRCLEPEFNEDGTCANADDLAKPSYIDGAYTGQEVSFNISEIQNNDVILVYKLRWYNYSDIATALYQKGVNEKYKEVKDSFGGALNLAYIDRDGSVTLTDTEDLKEATFDQTITVTQNTTIWRDVDFADGKYKSGTVTYDKTDWPVYYREYDKEITIKTYRTCNPTLQPGETQDVFSFIFYYDPIGASNKSASNVSDNSVYVPPTMNISGQIFLDEYNTSDNKITGKVNGIKDSNEQLFNEPVKVELYQYSYTQEEQQALINEEMVNQLLGKSPKTNVVDNYLDNIYHQLIPDENWYNNYSYEKYLILMQKYYSNTITSSELTQLRSYIRRNLQNVEEYVTTTDNQYKLTYTYKGEIIEFSYDEFKTEMDSYLGGNAPKLLDMTNKLMEILEKQNEIQNIKNSHINVDSFEWNQQNSSFGRLSNDQKLYLVLKETKKYIENNASTNTFWNKGQVNIIKEKSEEIFNENYKQGKYKYSIINMFNGYEIKEYSGDVEFNYEDYEKADYTQKKEYLNLFCKILKEDAYNSDASKIKNDIDEAIKYIDGKIKIYDYQTEKDRASTGDDYRNWDDLNKKIKSKFSTKRNYEKKKVAKYLGDTINNYSENKEFNFDIKAFDDKFQKLQSNNINNEEKKAFDDEFYLIYSIQYWKENAEHTNRIEELTREDELSLINLIEQYKNVTEYRIPQKNYKNQDIKFTEANTNELIKILQKFLKIGLTDEERNSIFNKDNFIDYQIVTNGQYEFKNYPVYSCEAFGDTPLYYLVNGQKMYYAVRFIYNGERYESTLYNQQGGINSRATEDLYINKGRSAFNQTLENSNYKFNYNSVTANEIAKNRLNEEFARGSSNEELLSNELLIDASTDPWEEPISAGNNTNVNLGLIRRNFDLRLETSLESMDVSINKVSQSFKGYGSTISANISSSDLVDENLNQKLAIQESDYEADDIDKQLEVWVNYKVKVSNESVAYYGNSKVEVYCDNRFTAFKIGNSSETQLNKNNGNNEPIVVDLSQVTLDDVESSKEINISMKLDRQTIKDIMKKNSRSFVRTLEFIAQINNYTSYYNDNAYGKGYAKGTIAGKLDEDSIPGNLDINGYNNLTTSKDNADRALGVQLIKQEESRKITGIVFEDATSQHDKDLRDEKAPNNAKFRYGNGKYREGGTDQKDKPIEGVKVKLIDGTSGGKVYDEVTSGDNGTYTIENVIPSANYTIEFTYGNGETKQYNYQDYKSTIDTSNINYDIKTNGTDSKGNVIVANGRENYWYSNAGNNSVAKDKKKKYNWEQSMTYTKAVKLENYKDSESNDLSNTAATAKFVVPITEYGKDSSGNAAFTINNMNFGLAEKPRSELTINKVVDHITITTSDGRTLIDGTPNGINSTSWTDRYVQAIVDENLIYGSTLKITYKYYVTNTGEIDFAYVGVNNFYDYGKIGQEGGMVIKTRADKIIDYVDNNLMYDEKMQANPEDTKLNENYWKIAEDEDLNLLGEKANKSAKNINTKLVTTELSEYLEPGESTEPIYLTLSKVLSSSEDKNKDALTYNNYAEIIQSTNQLGRRSYHTTKNPNNSEKDNYTTKEVRDDNGRITGFQITNTGNDKNILLSDVVNRGAPVTDEKMKQSGNQLVLSIPGDLDMSKLSAGETTLYWEPDSDIDLAGGSVQIVPPFGNQRVIWIIIATISTTILAVGIILIKKKVLK